MSKIELKNVTKVFGKLTALDNVSVTFEENTIYGLLGRNGAGKSTLLNLISNRLFPDGGQVLVDGENVTENDKALSKIYCMSDRDLFADSTKVKEVFEITANYYPDFDMAYANELAEKYALDTNKKVKSLSTGYRSIYKLITALASNAPIVFFDEPVLGLDANHRDMFYSQLIHKYMEKPATYIISTHLIEEAADIIEKVVILKNGVLISNEDTETLLSKGYAVSGAANVVDEFCKDKQVLGFDSLGGLKTAYILGHCDKSQINGYLEVSKLDLQKLFVQMTN